jgi:hypothetical protein
MVPEHREEAEAIGGRERPRPKEGIRTKMPQSPYTTLESPPEFTTKAIGFESAGQIR